MREFRSSPKVSITKVHIEVRHSLMRISVMNLLRMIKYFGWESRMDAKVAEKRDEELLWVWKRSVLDITNAMLK